VDDTTPARHLRKFFGFHNGLAKDWGGTVWDVTPYRPVTDISDYRNYFTFMMKLFGFHVELFKSANSDMHLLFMFRLRQDYVPTNVQYSLSYRILTTQYCIHFLEFLQWSFFKTKINNSASRQQDFFPSSWEKIESHVYYGGWVGQAVPNIRAWHGQLTGCSGHLQLRTENTFVPKNVVLLILNLLAPTVAGARINP
jgi:hypothetical protein